jgi:hypothetical protein
MAANALATRDGMINATTHIRYQRANRQASAMLAPFAPDPDITPVGGDRHVDCLSACLTWAALLGAHRESAQVSAPVSGACSRHE